MYGATIEAEIVSELEFIAQDDSKNSNDLLKRGGELAKEFEFRINYKRLERLADYTYNKYRERYPYNNIIEICKDIIRRDKSSKQLKESHELIEKYGSFDKYFTPNCNIM